MTGLASFREAARVSPGGLPGAGRWPWTRGARDDRAAFWIFALCMPMLIWPALWNGYPIVFADSGTYLSQAVHRYL